MSSTVRKFVDYMFDTLQCPPAEGDDYIGIFRTLGMRGIKRDPSWEEWHKYTDPQAKYNAEAGRIENIRFIETNHSTALSKIGLNSVAARELSLVRTQSQWLRYLRPS